MMHSDSRPLVTIITATYNLISGKRVDVFSHMLKSLEKQSYGRSHIEHIVVDGGSTDGTVDFLKEQGVDRWISESDTGMYQAMNRGVNLARGEIINFLNSDDFFYPQAVETSVAALQATNADYSYGGFTIHYSRKSMLYEPLKPLEYVYISAPFFFETMFIKKTCLQEMGGLDESFLVASDYDLMFRLYLQKKKGVPLQETIAGFRTKGVSILEYHRTVTEAAAIRTRYYFSQVPEGIINDPAMLCEKTTLQTLIYSLPDGYRLTPLVSFFSSQESLTHRLFYFLMKLYRKLRRIVQT